MCPPPRAKSILGLHDLSLRHVRVRRSNRASCARTGAPWRSSRNRPGRLHPLLSRPGDVVTREELRDAVWGNDTHVDFDRGLAYCLSQIRAALGDSGENPRFVQTMPKRGYKFIAPVTCSTGSQAPGFAVPVRSGVRRVGGFASADECASRSPPLARCRRRIVLLSIGMGWALTRAGTLPRDPIVIAVSVFDNETGMPEHDRLVAGLSDLVVDPPDRARSGAPRRDRQRRRAAAAAQHPQSQSGGGRASRPTTSCSASCSAARAACASSRTSSDLRDEAHLKANRLTMPDGSVAGLEDAVVAEFERAVREHVLTRGRQLTDCSSDLDPEANLGCPADGDPAITLARRFDSCRNAGLAARSCL